MIQGANPRLSNLLGASDPSGNRAAKDLKKLPEHPSEEQESPEVRRTVSETLFSHGAERRSWWWVELWSDKRELVKEAVAHSLLFAGLLASLEGAHWLLKWSTLPAEELYILNKVHFYMYAIILVIFAFSFIVKMLKSEFSGKAE